MNTLPKTTEMLHTLSIEQLKELKGQINQMIELKGGTKSTLKLGQEVMVNHPRLMGREGVITKINKTKCKVSFDGEIFNVPFEMIESI